MFLLKKYFLNVTNIVILWNIKESSIKKANEEHLEHIRNLEKKMYNLMFLSLNFINTCFVPFSNQHSLKVSAIWVDMNMNPPVSEEERYLTEKGFLSCHLSLIAQTEPL